MRCKERETTGCKWFIRGTISTVTESFFIQDAELKHGCPMAMYNSNSKRIGQQILGTIIKESLRATPTLTAIDMQFDMLNNLGFDITYEKIRRGSRLQGQVCLEVITTPSMSLGGTQTSSGGLTQVVSSL